ncbi:hypothetical protein DFH08DRAFT_993809 [Mycena albidolilacea]|uniref:Uncharacterized protein n=1 Tax=Mycena albidolilacea TaxID=1033008 RepID=A0AAD6YYS0_9AGAR|nr:hypothetical protein DFH08DRAFT_993809 [Mycena albidolilacea]
MPKEPTLSAHAARNPSQPVQQPRKRQSDATKATRALLVEQRHEQNLALDADLEEHHAKQEELIETLALKYGRAEEYMRTLVCNGASTATNAGSIRRTQSSMSTATRLGRELTPSALEGGPSNVRDVQDEMSGEEYKHIKDSLSKEDLARLRTQLQDYRDTKHHGVRATNKSCQLDAVQTANHVGEVLRNLHLRTGVAAFAIFTRGDPDDAAKPHIVDSDDASRFFIDVLKMSPLDAVCKMEQWACTRDTMDVDANTADAVRSQITEMANDGLRKIKNRQKPVTEWSNFRLKMMHELGVEMAGWPSNIEIKPPSKLCADDARRICDLMRTGAIHWVTLTASQCAEVAQEMEAERAAGTSKKRKRSKKDHPHGPRAKKSAANKGTKGEAGSPVAAVSTPASEASVASSAPAFGGGVSTSTVDAAFGPGFDLNFDFSFLDHPSFAHQLPAKEEVLQLNTSNLDHDNWGFGGLGANSPFVNAHGANGSLLSFNGDDEVFPAALVLPNVNTATTASTSSTSVFSIATNTTANKKRKRSGNDGGEKRPHKTHSDKDKPRGPRKSTTNMATANAAA